MAEERDNFLLKLTVDDFHPWFFSLKKEFQLQGALDALKKDNTSLADWELKDIKTQNFIIRSVDNENCPDPGKTNR